MKETYNEQSGESYKDYRIDGNYFLKDLLDLEKLEYFFDLFTASTGFTASLILHPDHSLLIKSGCRKLCTRLQCIDPEIARECVTEDLLLDSEIREIDEVTMRISSIGLADGALPVVVRGVNAGVIISGHVFLEKPDPEVLLKGVGSRDLDEYLETVGGIENIPVVNEEILNASLLMLRDMTVLLAEQRLNTLYGDEITKNLKDREQLLLGITNSLPGVVFRFYVKPGWEMGLYFVSGQSVNILGIDSSPEDFFPRVYNLIVSEERERFILSIKDVAEGFKKWDEEFRIITPGGEEKYIHGISEPERSGDEIVFNGVLLDVTARKRAELSLLESESRYREIFEDTMVGIYQSLPGGRYRIVNQAFAGMAGFESPEQMISAVTNIGEQLYANPAERIKLNALLHENGFVRNKEIEFKKINGEKFWGSVNTIVIKDENGEPLYYHGTVVDITDRKKAEDALRLSEERYRMIADFTGELIFDGDLISGNVQWAGDSRRMIGISLEELNAMDIAEWRGRIHPEDIERVSAVTDGARDAKDVFSVEYSFMKPDGTYMHVEESGGFLYDDAGKPARILGVMKNITDRVSASEERIQLERKLLYAQKMESLGIMAGGIAHDFNNLLMGIMGSLELAMIHSAPESDAYKNLTRAMNASRRAADITKQMLAYSGRGHFVMSRVEPFVLMAGMSDILRSAVNRTISIRNEIPGNLSEIMADVGQFQQVMMNLVTNSSEAIGDRQGEIIIEGGEYYISGEFIKKSPMLHDVKPGMYVYIDVIDNGCGMDDDIHSKLFDPFFSTKQTGRGLGLPAVQGIMRGHGGAVFIEGKMDSGSRARIIFPALGKKSDETGKTEPAPVHRVTAAGRADLILVVDDEDVVRDLCMEFVRIAGFRVVGAEDGERGLEIFRKESENLSCVLLDLSMPKMDGVTAFHEMKKINADIPVILCSGYSEEDAVRSFEGEKLAGFLQKPYKLDMLLEKLSSIVKKDTIQ